MKKIVIDEYALFPDKKIEGAVVLRNRKQRRSIRVRKEVRQLIAMQLAVSSEDSPEVKTKSDSKEITIKTGTMPQDNNGYRLLDEFGVFDGQKKKGPQQSTL